jgi:uncharacterized protein (TIGR02452 family)
MSAVHPRAQKLNLERRHSESTQLSATSQPSFGLSFSRGWLIHIANETVNIGKEGSYVNKKGEEVRVAEALRYAMNNSVHYHSSRTFNPSETTQHRFDYTEYHVCYGSSLQVASRLRDQLSQANKEFDIGILNSASGKVPEKFLRGTLSQEEGICRASLLYPCLIQYYNQPHHFYCINFMPKYQDSSSSCAIFSPHVPVIREDSHKGYLLDDFQTYSIVSIPAPNAFALGCYKGDDEKLVPKAKEPGSSEPYENMTIDSAMHDRIFRALTIFAEQGCTDLVLCAFGCGVHGNCPRQIASCFRNILTNELKGRFRTVVFAINSSRHHNYEEFVSIFEDIGEWVASSSNTRTGS